MISQHSPYQLAILRGLQSKHVYQGTVAPAEKARRRAANRVARRSRRTNRVSR
jgi:hypothetical protein